jgi:accessory gene regulator protein AgrB
MDKRAWKVAMGFMLPLAVWAATNAYVSLYAHQVGGTDATVGLFRLAKWSAFGLPWAMLASPVFVLLYLALVGVLTGSATAEPAARHGLLRWTMRAVIVSAIAWLCFFIPFAFGQFLPSLAWLSWGVAIVAYSAAAASALLIQTDTHREGSSSRARRGLLVVSVLAAVIPFWALLVPLWVYVRARRLS